MKTSRRRSLSASRTLDSTVSLVGRIGASLRMTTSKKRTKDKNPEKVEPIDENHSTSNNWLRNGAHYAKVGVERRRSTCSAIFFGAKSKAGHKFSFADKHGNREPEAENIKDGEQRLRVYNANPKRIFSHSKSSMEFFVSANNSEIDASDNGPQYIDAETEDEADSEKNVGSDNEDLDMDHLSLALVPLPNNGSGNGPSYWHPSVRSALSSPVPTENQINSGMVSSKSCPTTPQMPRRRYLKEGATQLTSLSTLCTHHRYLFLFNDLLLISKQKGENSYKLKEKVNLDRLWISSNNCTHSFLIGWPISNNYIAHFSCENEKNEWFQKLSDCIRRHFRPKTTTIAVAVQIEGREQCIRQEVHNGWCAKELIDNLTLTLDLPVLDTHLYHYELCFETGSHHSNSSSSYNSSLTTSTTSSNGSTTAINPIHQNSSHHHFGSHRCHPFNGVENVYAVLMDYAQDLQLSDSQLAHLDTCPLVNCRLMLRQVHVNGNTSGAFASKSAALNIVNQFRKVLSRTESSSKRLFGRQLDGSMPPQPVLTMIDHLTIHGAYVEGIFRKSPKQATVRVLKSQLDRGQVPDFHQYNVHVTASLLKEYLRSIPGQLLISNNYHLWMEVCPNNSDDAEPDEAENQRRLKTCKNLLRLLPACHTVLLRSLLRLLRRIVAAEQTSKMSAHSLAVCLAPSLLENPNVVDSARKIPELAIYLIEHAGELFEGLVEECLLPPPNDLPTRMAPPANSHPSENDEDEEEELEEDDAEIARRLHQSTDSGLSADGDISTTSSTTHKQQDQQQTRKKSAPEFAKVQRLNVSTFQNVGKLSTGCLAPPTSVSPDSALFEIPLSDCSSYDDEQQKHRYQRKIGKNNWLTAEKRRECRPNAGIRIEEIECEQDERTLKIRSKNALKAFSPKSCSRENSVEFMDNEDEDDDKTPTLLSRENSDVKTQFGARPDEWKSKAAFLNNNNNVPMSTRRKAPLLAQDSEPASPIANDVRILRLKANSASPCTSPQMVPRFPTAPTSFQISNLDDLRVSDYIISQKSTPNTRKNYDMDKDPSRKSSSTKTSTNTTDSEHLHKNPLLRRTALLTRNESLGISGAPQRKTSANEMSTDNALSSKSFNAHNLTKNELLKPVVNEIKRVPLTTSNIQKHNNSLTATSYGQKELNILRASTDKKPEQMRPKIIPSFESQQHSRLINTTRISHNTNNNAVRCAGLVADVAQKHRNPSRERGGLNSASSSFSSTSTNCGTKAGKWRPPKRTAEEIVLDKLEVNWSVPNIRQVFQQHKDVKPTNIDTVYARVS